MRTSYLPYVVSLVLFVVDLLIINSTFWLVFFYVDQFKHLSDTAYRNYLLIFNIIWLFSANFFQMYSHANMKSSEIIYRSTWRSLLTQAILFIVYLLFTMDSLFSRQFLILLYLALFLNFLVSRFFGTFMELKLKHRLSTKKPVAVLGKNKTGSLLAGYFENNNDEYDFEGFLNESPDLFANGMLVPEITEAIESAARKGIKEIYAPLALEHIMEARYLLREAENQCVRLKFIPVLRENSAHAYLKVDYMGEFPIISLRKEPLEDPTKRFQKRVFDVVFSLMVIVFLLSWLYPFIALLIKLKSPGPVLFKQQRSGRDNENFICYKFRTMRVNADSDRVQATENDQRVTTLGKFLRKTSMDELPQFFNVLKGDMSVVGPRPHMLKHTEEYSAIINGFMVRHFLKPGITGWAQINGYRGKTSTPAQMQKRVAHDIWYLENWSIMLDVKIIFLTIINVLKGEENAY